MIVVIKTRPHGRFRRMGDDLVCQFELTLLEALTGFRSSSVTSTAARSISR